MRNQWSSIRIFLLITGAAFAIRLPFALERYRFVPDSLAYLNIARNVAAGSGFVSGLKLCSAEPSRVVHNALSDWPPLYPAAAGGLAALGCSEVWIQALNALLAAICAGLVFAIGARLFDRRVGVVAGACAAASPVLFRAGITALSDPLGLALALLSLWAGVTAAERPRLWMLAGLAAGTACLARYPNAVLVLALVPLAMRRGGSRAVIACLAGVVLLCGPVVAWNMALYGSPLYSVQLLHYAGPSFTGLMWSADVSTGPRYVSTHVWHVAAAIIRNAGAYAFDLFVGLRGLCVLSAGLLAWAVSCRRETTTEHRAVLVVAALNFLVYALTWSIPPVRGSRFLLLSYCLLLPLGAEGFIRLWDAGDRFVRVGVGVAVTALMAIYGWGCITAAVWRGGEFEPLTPEVARLISRPFEPDTNIASNNPWMVNYSTGLPSAVLPRDLDRAGLLDYMRRYDIGGIVVFEPGRRSRTVKAILRSPRDFRVLHIGPKAFAALPNYDGRQAVSFQLTSDSQ